MTNTEQHATRPEDVLPDGVERATIGGVEVRKGTVAAFLQNAQRWLGPDTPDDERAALGDEMARAAPALRALGLLDICVIRDERLRTLIERS